MIPLPIDPRLREIAAALRASGALVLVGPPGSGKTTRVPPAILESGLRSPGRVLVLEPRRIAARAAAARVASERGWRLGEEVGYTVRFEDRSGPRTRIRFLTQGVLARLIQADPFLEGTAAVVLDEFHERSLEGDLALALLREARAAGRDDLLLLVMSATLDPAPVAAFLGGCPALEVAGRPHPVEVRWLDRPDRSEPAALAARAVRELWGEGRGDVLVFLPGIREIRRAARELEPFARAEGARLAPLHGGLGLEEQDAALRPSPPGGGRKVVLATNIAETSLTVEGVDLVVDTGLARVLRVDPRHGIDRLETVRASRASAEQRAGRAGRTGPGIAMRLWTRAEHADLPGREEPEVRRVDLTGAVLELRAWGARDPAAFGWLEPPEPSALERAGELLAALGAVEGRGGPLTPLGRSLLGIPAHPRLARIVAAAHARGVLREGAALAALIEERDIVPLDASAGPRRASSEGPSDLLLRLDLLGEVERGGFRREGSGRADPAAARAAVRARDVLIREARRALGPERAGREGKRSAAAREGDILRALLAGYPDRVVRRRAPGSDRGRMAGGRGVVLSPASVVRDAPFFLALDLDAGAPGERADAVVHAASAVRREWIEEDLAGEVREEARTWFDEEAGKVRSTAVLLYRDLPLEEPRDRPPGGEEAERLLGAAVRERAEAIAASSEEAARLLARIRSLAGWMPELGLPRFGPEELGEALAPACAGRVSLAEVRSADLAGLLRGRLAHAQAAALDRQAPESLEVPSGSRIRLAYEPGKPPVLAARVQELFGLHDTPAVAGGRVPVLLHILGPNFRPVQVTQDLRSFWSGTYHQVRKDLRARYPRHAWPEDPWTARAESRPRRRRS